MSAAIGSCASQPTVADGGGPAGEPATHGIARSIATTTSASARPGPVSSSGCRDGTLSRSRQSVSAIHAPAVSASSASGATVRGSRPLAPVTRYGHSAFASAAASAAIASGSGCAGAATPRARPRHRADGHVREHDLARQRHEHRARRSGRRHLQSARHDRDRVVLQLQPPRPLHVAAHRLAQVARLLQPEDRVVERAAHRPVRRGRRRAREQHDRMAVAARRVQRRARVQQADVDVHRERRRPPRHHRVAERRVQRRRLVQHRDQLRRGLPERGALRDAFLQRQDVRARGEEEPLDAARRERGDDRLAGLPRLAHT